MRNTHPNLYKTYVTYALLSIALGLNFLFLRPAFMPLDMPRWPIGLVFLGCGVSKLLALMLPSPHVLLRLSMSLSVAIYTFWGGLLTFEFVRLSQTSLQLPLTYIGLAVLGVILLTEPLVNPATAASAE